MIIASIEAVPLHIPFRSPSCSDAGAWGDGNLAAIDALLVKVTSSDGLVGWGETFGFAGVGAARLLLESLIAPACIGKDDSDVASLMAGLERRFHIYGLVGPLMYAISAIDIALWDIAGKRVGKPVHRLLAEARSNAPLRAYASLIRYTDPKLVAAGVRRARDAGFECLKLHEIELSAISAAREAAGADTEIMLDVNCPWTLEEATSIAEKLEVFDLRWLEEPIWPPDDFEGLAELRRRTDIPIAAGENATSFHDFERLIRAGSVDIVQPSPAKMGGITALRRIFPLAAAHGVEVMVHSFYDGPGLLAAIHASAALGSNLVMIERRFFDLELDLFQSAPLRAGFVDVPSAPGLGFEPDQTMLDKFRLT